MTEKLFFNGVNGDTGQYGMPPMSAEALADRLLGERYRAVRQRQELQRSLVNRTLNEQKVLDIVACLMEDILALRSEPEHSSLDWPTTAADSILEILLGSEVTPTPEDRRFLTHRLQQQPVETVVRIVKLLQGGQGFVLTQWLLTHQETDPGTLYNSLTAKFDQAVNAIRLTYLHVDGPEMRDAGGALREAWVTGFTDALDRLPMTSLQALPGKEALVGSLRRLVRELKRTHLGTRKGAGQTVEVARSLAALEALSEDASWHGIVANLRELLSTLQRASVPLDGGTLRNVLTTWVDDVHQRITAPLGVVPWIDPTDLSQTGWGIIFPAAMSREEQTAIETALGPLLARRSQQAGPLYRCYKASAGYRPGDTAHNFLRRPPRRATAANPAAPDGTGVPYYLLLIGDPEQIPFEFQYQLDVQYAVGRLDFGDDLAAYRRYADNVVAAETRSAAPQRQLVFFGTEHPGDEATALSARHLVAPLGRSVRRRSAGEGWRVLTVDPEKANKANLLRLLRMDPSPALLFTATHGLEFAADHPRQPDQQGALLCQDWDGAAGAVADEAWFGAQDVTSDLNLRGTILLLFACHGAGTPQHDDYHRAALTETPDVIAERPFVAALPKALLALRERGALAVIGHVGRVWGLSFLSEVSLRPEGMTSRKREHLEVFQAATEQLLAGQPVGAALDYFDMRYAALATELATLYDHLEDPPTAAEIYRLAELWTASHDARSYVVLGDPAVRLRPGD